MPSNNELNMHRSRTKQTQVFVGNSGGIELQALTLAEPYYPVKLATTLFLIP